jgi:hypothetical protein
MNKKKNSTFNNILVFLGALIVPYAYYFTIRPKLIKYEESFENKITNISDKELDKMKAMIEMMKNDTQNLNENDNIKK